MRKLFFVCFLATFAVINLWADELVSVPVATLTHNGEARQFYGASALNNAHAAAVSGDVITLNSGNFNACDITKGITLRGACMSVTTEMSQAGMKFTRIQNDMRIKVPSSDPNTLKIEDLCFSSSLTVDSVSHVTFTRIFQSSNSLYVYSAKAMQCDIIQSLIYNLYTYYPNAEVDYYLSNSTFYSIQTYNGYMPRHLNAQNCFINSCSTGVASNPDGIFYNSIINFTLPSGTTAYYCVAPSSSYFNGGATCSNCKTVSFSDLFGVSSPSFPYTRRLTETAAATYLGTDGTKVGIYGGLFPFTFMPDNPLVTRCDIANKTTEDGKLKVEIEVKSVQ